MAGSDINQEHRPAQLQGCHPCPAVKSSPKSRQAESSRSVLRKGLPAGADLDPPQGHPAKKTHEAGKQESHRIYQDPPRQGRHLDSQVLGREKVQSTMDTNVTEV